MFTSWDTLMFLAEKLGTLFRIVNFVFTVWLFIPTYKRVTFSIIVSSYKLHYLFCPPLSPYPASFTFISTHIIWCLLYFLYSSRFKRFVDKNKKFVDKFVLWYPGNNNIWMNKWIIWLKQFIHMSVWQLFHIMFCIKMVCCLF